MVTCISDQFFETLAELGAGGTAIQELFFIIGHGLPLTAI